MILPTYNEATNISTLVPLIAKHMRTRAYEVIVVDDNSPDGTAHIARTLQAHGYPVRVIVRKKVRGLASATLRGIRAAKYPLVAVMDSDMQHHPRYLPKMIRAIEKGADMAIGSRYVQGGCFKKLTFVRKVLSLAAVFITKPLTGVHDPLGQFYMVRKSALKKVRFQKIGFRLSMEIMVKGAIQKIVEIPIVFQKRFTGKSKLNLTAAFTDLMLIAHLYWWKLIHSLPQQSYKPAHPVVTAKV
jgi:dolichol-phosphate mannosyltransferase